MNHMNAFARQSWIAIRLLIVGVIVLGIVYPLLVTGVGKVVAADAANGSLITSADGVVVGEAVVLGRAVELERMQQVLCRGRRL